MRAAVSTGCTLWNGGEFYGTDAANSMTIMRRYFTEHPEDAEKVAVCIKGGVDRSSGRPRQDGSAAQMRKSMDNILAQLGGAKKVDLFECARRDPETPLEETFGVLNEYVEAGKLGGISLSEVSAATIHEAAGIIRIKAVEVELSLWSTDPLENGIAEACAQHNIPLMAYSPLGMGVSLPHSNTALVLRSPDARRPVQDPRRHPTKRPPPPLPALPVRELPHQPRARAKSRGARSQEGVHSVAAGAGVVRRAFAAAGHAGDCAHSRGDDGGEGEGEFRGCGAYGWGDGGD